MVLLKLCDLEFAIYAATTLVSLIGFGLFAWWWRRMRRATQVYAYVTILLGIFIYHHGLLALVQGMCLLGYSDAKFYLTHSYWWKLRTLPELFCVGLFVQRMWSRAMRTMYLERRYLKKGISTCLGEGLEDGTAEED